MHQAILIVDLGFGDAGKGTITDYLTRKYCAHTVVRYNGGAQAAHNVITPEGNHHTFAQFGSGSLAGADTHLSQYVFVEPFALLNEGQHLQQLGVSDVFDRITIDQNAPVITRYHQAANRLKEISRGQARHGSCGVGVGETASDLSQFGDQCLRISDLNNPPIVAEKLHFVKELKEKQLGKIIDELRLKDEAQKEIAVFSQEDRIPFYVEEYQRFSQKIKIVDENYLGRILRKAGTVLFEGAQGVLLDEWYGFHPYTTWSNTSLHNAHSLLHTHIYDGAISRLGIVRGYATRHGPGPFVTESPRLTTQIADSHNNAGTWQGSFRLGHFDAVATNYALAVAGSVDSLAVTCVDRMSQFKNWQVATSYFTEGDHFSFDRFFEGQGRRINAIRFTNQHNLAHQEDLTRRLFECRPNYDSSSISGKPFEAKVADHLAFLAECLKVPVTIASFGPSACDKRVYSPVESFQELASC